MAKPKKFVFSRREAEIPEELTEGGALAERIVEQRVTGADWRGRTGASLRVENSVLERVCLAECRFGSLMMRDVRLVNCDLANLQIRGWALTRVEFIDCRMTGLTAAETEALDVLAREGDLRYSQFRDSRFRSTEFDGCNLEEADFQGTDLTGTVFRKCNMRNVEMGQARLPDADLRGSAVEGLHIGVEGLRGAVVDPAQAMQFALLLGIRIE